MWRAGMPCCLTFRSRSLPKFTGNPADATDCWLGENMAFLPFSSVNFNRQNGPMNSVSSCKFTVPHMFSQKMLMEEPFPAMEWLYWLLEFVFGGDPAWRTSSRCWEWAFHSTEVSNLRNAGEVSSASCTHNSQHLSQMQVFGNNATNTHHKCLVLSYQFWLFLFLWSNSCTFSTFLVQKLPYMKHANLYQGNPFSTAEIGGAQHSSTSGHCFVNLEDVELNGHQTSGE